MFIPIIVREGSYYNVPQQPLTKIERLWVMLVFLLIFSTIVGATILLFNKNIGFVVMILSIVCGFFVNIIMMILCLSKYNKNIPNK